MQPNATKRNETQPNATKRNQTQPNATVRNRWRLRPKCCKHLPGKKLRHSGWVAASFFGVFSLPACRAASVRRGSARSVGRSACPVCGCQRAAARGACLFRTYPRRPRLGARPRKQSPWGRRPGVGGQEEKNFCRLVILRPPAAPLRARGRTLRARGASPGVQGHGVVPRLRSAGQAAATGAGMTAAYDETAGGLGGNGTGLSVLASTARMESVWGSITSPREADACLLASRRSLPMSSAMIKSSKRSATVVGTSSHGKCWVIRGDIRPIHLDSRLLA